MFWCMRELKRIEEIITHNEKPYQTVAKINGLITCIRVTGSIRVDFWARCVCSYEPIEYFTTIVWFIGFWQIAAVLNSWQMVEWRWWKTKVSIRGECDHSRNTSSTLWMYCLYGILPLERYLCSRVTFDRVSYQFCEQMHYQYPCIRSIWTRETEWETSCSRFCAKTKRKKSPIQ